MINAFFSQVTFFFPPLLSRPLFSFFPLYPFFYIDFRSIFAALSFPTAVHVYYPLERSSYLPYISHSRPNDHSFPFSLSSRSPIPTLSPSVFLSDLVISYLLNKTWLVIGDLAL